MGIRTLSGNIQINTNYANSNTSWLIEIVFSTKVALGDKVRIKVPKSITVNSCTAQCTNCNCNLEVPT